jgi:hypothetical protein
LLFATAAFAKWPPKGSWSGTSATPQSGFTDAKLPISFTYGGGDISALTLGPAQITCRGNGVNVTETMPQLTGFPAERVTDRIFPQYTYNFEQTASGSFTLLPASTELALANSPLEVSFAGEFTGKRFWSHGGLEVYYNATTTGTPQPGGPVVCEGAWQGTFAKHH